MDLTQLIGNYPVVSVTLLTFATIGTLKFVRALLAREWAAAITIAAAAAVPALLSGLVDGITPLVGAIIGLNAAGVITIATRLAGGDTKSAEVADKLTGEQ